jgi:hypothetical protein
MGAGFLASAMNRNTHDSGRRETLVFNRADATVGTGPHCSTGLYTLSPYT